MEHSFTDGRISTYCAASICCFLKEDTLFVLLQSTQLSKDYQALDPSEVFA